MVRVPAWPCQHAPRRSRACVAHGRCPQARPPRVRGGGAASAHPQRHERRQPRASSCVGGGHWRWCECLLGLASMPRGGQRLAWHIAGALRCVHRVSGAVEPLPHTPSCAASRARRRAWGVADGSSACLPGLASVPRGGHGVAWHLAAVHGMLLRLAQLGVVLDAELAAGFELAFDAFGEPAQGRVADGAGAAQRKSESLQLLTLGHQRRDNVGLRLARNVGLELVLRLDRARGSGNRGQSTRLGELESSRKSMPTAQAPARRCSWFGPAPPPRRAAQRRAARHADDRQSTTRKFVGSQEPRQIPAQLSIVESLL